MKKCYTSTEIRICPFILAKFKRAVNGLARVLPLRKKTKQKNNSPVNGHREDSLGLSICNPESSSFVTTFFYVNLLLSNYNISNDIPLEQCVVLLNTEVRT